MKTMFRKLKSTKTRCKPITKMYKHSDKLNWKRSVTRYFIKWTKRQSKKRLVKINRKRTHWRVRGIKNWKRRRN